VGIDVETEVIDWARLRDMFRNKNIQCCLWPNIIPWRPAEDYIRVGYYSKSASHTFEDEFIDKHYQALAQATDPQERQRLARAVGDHLFEEFATIPLIWFHNEVVANPKVVADWQYPGLGGGRSTHFHLLKAVK
jgi:ABC-type transport system substrate-binding protein